MTHQEKLENIGGEINEAAKNLIDEAKLQWEKNGNLIVGVFVATTGVPQKVLPITTRHCNPFNYKVGYERT